MSLLWSVFGQHEKRESPCSPGPSSSSRHPCPLDRRSILLLIGWDSCTPSVRPSLRELPSGSSQRSEVKPSIQRAHPRDARVLFYKKNYLAHFPNRYTRLFIMVRRHMPKCFKYPNLCT